MLDWLLYASHLCGELFLKHNLSDLPLCPVALSGSLSAWPRRQQPLCRVRKVVGLNDVDRLVQPSCQVVSHALRRDMQLLYTKNDIVVMSALVLRHCSHLF